MTIQVNEVDGGEEARLECSNCHSLRSWKDGMRRTENGETQRYICRDCGTRFSRPLVLSMDSAQSRSRQVCVTSQGAKNLAAATETRTVAGESSIENQGDIVEYLWYLKKRGYSEATIQTRVKLLKLLKKRGANLLDSESVKRVIAEQDVWSSGHKQVVVQAYNSFAKMRNMQWEPPFYVHVKSLPFIPSEKEIDALISGTSRKIASSLQLLKETGMRIGEAWNLKWIDIDQEKNTIRCRAEKHGNPREFKVSTKLLAMLSMLPKTSDYVFAKTNLSGHRWSYEKQRKRLAENCKIQGSIK